MRQIVLDTETTGLEWKKGNRVVEIGCVELIERRPTGRTYHQYINPQREFEQGAAEGVFHVADARFTTRSLFGMLQGIPEWYAASGPSTPEQIAEQYVDNALRLVGSNAERASGKARARS